MRTRLRTMSIKTMRTKAGAFTLSALCSVLLSAGAFAADSAGEPGRGNDGKNPLNNVV